MSSALRGYRVGWVRYINFFPVAWQLARMWPQQFSSFQESTPQRLNAALAAGDLDIALTSVSCLCEHPALEVCCPWGICVDGAVHSVYLGLQHQDPELLSHIHQAQNRLSAVLTPAFLQQHQGRVLQTVQEMRLIRPYGRPPLIRSDPESGTSILLAEILYFLWFGERPRRVGMEAEMSVDGDGGPQVLTLVIGDKAFGQRVIYPVRMDLALMWRRQFSLPMVFAIWMGSRVSEEDHGYEAAVMERQQFCKVLREAIAAVEWQMARDPQFYMLAAQKQELYRDLLDGHGEAVLSYWQNTIYYRVGDRERRAMELFCGLGREYLQQRYRQRCEGDGPSRLTEMAGM